MQSQKRYMRQRMTNCQALSYPHVSLFVFQFQCLDQVLHPVVGRPEVAAAAGHVLMITASWYN